MFSTAYLDQFGLCRLCLVRERVNIPIFEDQGGNFPFINLKINTCLPVKVDINDKLPKKICVDCYYKLESFYQFYNVSADAEKQLLSWIEEETSPPEQEEEKIHLTKKLQQKVNRVSGEAKIANLAASVETASEDPKSSSKPSNNESNVIHVKEELDDKVSENKDNSDHDSDWQDNHFTSCQVEMTEESDEWTPEVEQKPVVKKKVKTKNDTPKKKNKKKAENGDQRRVAKSQDTEAKFKIKRGKRLIKSTFFYKLLNEKEYECLECQEKFQSLKRVRIHFRQKHTEKYIFKCTICEKTFTTAPAFKSHQKDEHGIEKDDIFNCDQCDYASSSKHAVEIHKLRKHTVLELIFECDICKRKFKTKDDIRLHMSNHDETEHMCDICGHFFTSQHSLVRHRRVRHINTYDFQCSICKIKLISQINLDNHMRENHNPNDQIKCKECGQEFKMKRYLIRHVKRVHQKLEKVHLCTVCGKSFVCMNTFRIHYLTHTKIKPYVCNVCGDAFSQRSSMMLHWKKQHPDADEPPPKVTLTNVFENFNLIAVGENNYNIPSDITPGNSARDS